MTVCLRAIDGGEAEADAKHPESFFPKAVDKLCTAVKNYLLWKAIVVDNFVHPVPGNFLR